VKRRNLICLVTDRHRLSPGTSDKESLDRLVSLVQAAARAGVDIIQLRERDLDARRLAATTARCIDAVARRAILLVNDRVDVVLATGADGVHLRSDGVDAPTVRGLKTNLMIGRSVHREAEAVESHRGGGLDYLLFGTVFPTISKPDDHEIAGVQRLAAVCAAVPLPVLAIGGITAERARAVVERGAAGVAAIGMFLPKPGAPFDRHLAKTVAALRQAFDTCGPRS
jgi:thiamine-phosphate pyrophosphorylase